MFEVTATATEIGYGKAAADSRKTFSQVPFKYRHDAAQYVAAIVMELRQIAEQAELGKIVGALDEAYYEAYATLSNECQKEAQANPVQPATAAK